MTSSEPAQSASSASSALHSLPARERIIAVLWGFAEATVFFIVPDVLTSRVALTHTPRQALAACGWAVIGALVGGNALYAFAQFAPAAASGLLNSLDVIPGISPPLIASAGDQIRAHGSAAFFTSALAGIPYKVCTLQASLLGVSYPAFLVMSALSRSLRFLAVTGIALVCRHFFSGRCSPRVRLIIHLTCWTLFYSGYFYTMSR